MKETPSNKMIKTLDENTKKVVAPVVKSPKKITTFYFPQQQKTVAAESYEEALKIINNTKEE